MLKKALFIGVGVALLATPFISSAQSVTASATISSLQAEIQSLLAQLQALQSGSGASVSVSGGAISSPANPATPSCPAFTRSLSIGESGSDVSALQAFLVAHGYLSVSPTGYFGALTQAAVGAWQAQNGVVQSDGAGYGTFGPLSRSFFARSCGGSTNTSGSEPNIEQANAPASVSLSQGGIAEIRNESFYFTLQSLTQSSATIQITPVGCWNSFPSDTPPAIRCMIAMVPIPPQTLSIEQSYASADYGIELTGIAGGEATFSVTASSTAQ